LLIAVFISLYCYLSDQAAAKEVHQTKLQITGDNASNIQKTDAGKPEKAPGIFRRMRNWMESWAGTKYALLALIILAFAESSFFPLPPDILLIALCLASPASSFHFALACSLASAGGGLFGYLLGRLLYDPVVRPVSRFIRLDKYLDSALEYYKKYDVWAVGIAGFTPIPYKVFTIAGGLARLNIFKFALISLASRSARFFLVAALLFFFGEASSDFIEKYFNILSVVFVILLVGSFILMGWFFGKKGKEAPDEAKVSQTPQETSTAAERGNESGAAKP